MNHLQLSSLNLFSSQTTDRAPEQRSAETTLACLINSESSRFLPVSGTNVFVRREASGYQAALLSLIEFEKTFGVLDDYVYLGREFDLHYFATIVEENSSKHGEFVDLRACAALLDERHAALLSYARAILNWRKTQSFCGSCGARTVARSGGHVLQCTAPQCTREHYPRTDPAIIVLVENGDEALFGRKSEWPEKRYSTIAGFVEPGESAEQAVIREVAEETGIQIESARYHSSQPWPFPGTLMLGYQAQAASRSISLNDKELEDACWLSRKQIREGLATGQFQLPTDISISFRLIEDWYNRIDGASLRTLRNRYDKDG